MGKCKICLRIYKVKLGIVHDDSANVCLLNLERYKEFIEKGERDVFIEYLRLLKPKSCTQNRLFECLEVPK